jgi:hypothetical protein
MLGPYTVTPFFKKKKHATPYERENRIPAYLFFKKCIIVFFSNSS